MSPSKQRSPGTTGDLPADSEHHPHETALDEHQLGHQEYEDSDTELDLDPETCNYTYRMVELKTEDEWQGLMKDWPWSMQTWRVRS